MTLQSEWPTPNRQDTNPATLVTEPTWEEGLRLGAEEKGNVDADSYPCYFWGRFHVDADAQQGQDEEKGTVGEPLKYPGKHASR